MDDGLNRLLVDVGASIREAMRAIDAGACELALAVSDNLQLVGTISDGDIRRALLAGSDLDEPVKPFINRAPLVVTANEPRASVVDLMQARRVAQVPIVDDARRVVGMHLLSRLLGRVSRPNIAVVMAGGRGTRLGALTNTIPKPMLPVAGRPILERIVLHLVGSGITDIALSINYLGDQIEAYFGTGEQFGCRITYLRESPDTPLGTAGSLALLDQTGLEILEPTLVMNGDLVTQFDLAALLRAHESSNAAVTVAGRSYTHAVPFGVLEVDDDGVVSAISEKPLASWWVAAGIYVLDPDVVASVPRDMGYDLPVLLADHLREGGRVNFWALEDDWHDVGRPDDLHRAQGLL